MTSPNRGASPSVPARRQGKYSGVTFEVPDLSTAPPLWLQWVYASKWNSKALLGDCGAKQSVCRVRLRVIQNAWSSEFASRFEFACKPSFERRTPIACSPRPRRRAISSVVRLVAGKIPEFSIFVVGPRFPRSGTLFPPPFIIRIRGCAGRWCGVGVRRCFSLYVSQTHEARHNRPATSLMILGNLREGLASVKRMCELLVFFIFPRFASPYRTQGVGVVGAVGRLGFHQSQRSEQRSDDLRVMKRAVFRKSITGDGIDTAGECFDERQGVGSVHGSGFATCGALVLPNDQVHRARRLVRG